MAERRHYHQALIRGPDGLIKPIRLGTRINNHVISYLDLVEDEEGWVDSEKFLPYEFEICFLKIERENRIIDAHGWFCGNSWDGRHVHYGDKVIKWKRRREEVLSG